jgi:uncharacterized protein
MTQEEPTFALPWYKEGLRFQCTECGKCCTGGPGYVWITEEEIVEMAEFLNISPDVFKKTYVRRKDNRYALIEKKSQNYDCVFLKDKKCSIYKARPKQCRTFPWWKHNLISEESWKEASISCEGINDQAPLHPLSEIMELFH